MPELYERYVVKKGDTLWDPAGRFLGSPLEWPRLYALNNQRSAIAINGRGIKNPDLIYVGQKLLIPKTFQPPQSWRPTPLPPRRADQPGRLRDALSDLSWRFTGAYKLDDIPLASIVGPGFKATIKFAGNVLITLGHPDSLGNVGNEGLDISNKSRANRVLGLLIAEGKLNLNRKTNQITYTCNLIVNSSSAGGPVTCIGVAVASDKPVPVLRGEIRYPRLSGLIHGNQYAAFDVKIVIEIELDAPQVRTVPERGPEIEAARNVRSPAPVSSPVQQVAEVTLWVIIGALVARVVGPYFSVRASVPQNGIPLPLLFSPGGMPPES